MKYTKIILMGASFGLFLAKMHEPFNQVWWVFTPFLIGLVICFIEDLVRYFKEVAK